MNKTIALLFSSLLMSGLVIAQDQSSSAAPAATPVATTETTPATTQTPSSVATEVAAPAPETPVATEVKAKGACCTPKPSPSSCPKTAHMKKCCHDVLTPEERHHFCEIKCKVLEANPSLKDKKKKHELCEAILNEAAKEEGKKPEETSVKPILDKLKKHCELEHQKKKMEQNAATAKS